MKQTKSLFILFIILQLNLTGCSNVFMKADVENTTTNCFNLMWQNIDEHYSFFDYKKIDWKAVKNKYAPKVNDKISQDSLYKVLSSMLYELRDGHVNLSTATDRSRNWSWKEDHPDNFNSNFVFRHYFKKDFKMTGALPNQILSDSVGYIRYSSFSNSISEGDLDYILYRFKDVKGLIIDVRDNGGGSMATIFRLMNRFVEKRTLVGYMNVKNGKNHNDFAKPQEFWVEPNTKRVPFTRPIVVLTNRGCYSATTHFAAFMSQLPNVTIVGDNTGGGGGIPISADLPNGWQYRFSATYQTTADGYNFELGMPPDIEITTGPKEELEGKDAIIEKAIEVIKDEVKKKTKTKV
jgi:Peptidase family S41/Tricorn protease C1 domain